MADTAPTPRDLSLAAGDAATGPHAESPRAAREASTGGRPLPAMADSLGRRAKALASECNGICKKGNGQKKALGMDHRFGLASDQGMRVGYFAFGRRLADSWAGPAGDVGSKSAFGAAAGAT